jgi:hypothetical protein
MGPSEKKSIFHRLLGPRRHDAHAIARVVHLRKGVNRSIAMALRRLRTRGRYAR